MPLAAIWHFNMEFHNTALAWITIILGVRLLALSSSWRIRLNDATRECVYARLVTGCGGVGEVQSRRPPTRPGRLNKITLQHILRRKKRGMFPHETPRFIPALGGPVMCTSKRLYSESWVLSGTSAHIGIHVVYYWMPNSSKHCPWLHLVFDRTLH